jgi:hypothetical protein
MRTKANEFAVEPVKVVHFLEPTLNQNEVDAIKQWTFMPTMKDSEPVPVQVEVEVNFRVP